MSVLSIALLGELEITLDGVPASGLTLNKTRVLLGYLAMEGHRAHSREALAALLWPASSQANAAHNLRQALYQVRQALDDGSEKDAFLRVTRSQVQFDQSAEHSLDVTAFTSLIQACRAHTHRRLDACPACAKRLEEASRLYRGRFLGDVSLRASVAFEEWRSRVQATLHDQVMEVLTHLAAYYERTRAYKQAASALRRQLEWAPWREEAHRARMRVLALDGQRDAALAQYRACVEALAVELSVDPAPETVRLRQQIVAGAVHPASESEAGEEASAPYKGLSAFGRADAADFCGRETYVARLREAVEKQETVVVLGASGSGKSSLVQAGLLPNLDDTWQVVQCRPGSHPFERLAEALLPALSASQRRTGAAREALKQELAGELREGKLALAELAQRTVAGRGSSGGWTDRRQVTDSAGASLERSEPVLLLVIDQFEELYSLCTDRDARQAYLDLLFPSLKADAIGQNLVRLICLRADFLGQTLASRPLADAIQAGRLILGPMNQAELCSAIEQPGRMRGAVFEPGLIERLQQDVGQEPGYLPLLQFTLTQLWAQRSGNRLTHAAYSALGGVAGALTRYAEEVHAMLSEPEQESAQRILTLMVSPGQGTGDTRRLVLRSELGEHEWPLVHKLANARLVVMGGDPEGNETVEVVHEALLRHWDRLRGWLQADRGFRQWQERLRASVEQWARSGRDEGALLRGALLSEAEPWAAQRGRSLSAAQQAYISASVQQRQRREAEREAQRQRELRAARLAQSLRLAANARLALRDQDTELALVLALEANRGAGSGARSGAGSGAGSGAAGDADPPPEAQRVLSEAAYAPGTRRLYSGHGPYVRCLALRADGRTAISGGADQSLIQWDLMSGRAMTQMRGHKDTVFCVAYSPDGRTALSGSADRTLILWDLETSQALCHFQGHDGGVLALAVHPSGHTALSGSGDRRLIRWDLETGQVLRRYEGHREVIQCLAISPDGRTALSGDVSGCLIEWDLESGEICQRLTRRPSASGDLAGDANAHAARARGVAFLPGGEQAISVGEDRCALIWDLRCGEVAQRFEFSDVGGLYSVDLSPDGRVALINTRDNPAILLSLDSGQVQSSTFGRRGRIECLVYHPDGEHVLSGTANGQVRLSDLYGGAEVRRIHLAAVHGDVTRIDISPDGCRGLSGHRDHSLALWDVTDPASTELRRWVGHEASLTGGVRFLPDGRRALSGAGGTVYPSLDTTLRLWDLATGREMCRFQGHTDPVWDMDVSRDGRVAVSASRDGTVRLWILDAPGKAVLGEDGPAPARSTGQVVYDFVPQSPRCVALSPDGGTVLVGLDKESSPTPDYDLWLLDLSNACPAQALHTGEWSGGIPVDRNVPAGHDPRPLVRRYVGHSEPVLAVAMSSDGRFALSGALSGIVFLWNVETGQLIRRLYGHSSSVLGAAFGPHGRIAVTSSQSGSLIVWDLERGEALRRYLGHRGAVVDLCIAPDGRTVFSAGADLTIRQWRIDATQKALMDWIRENRHVPELTSDQRVQYRLDLLDVAAGGETRDEG